MFEVYFCTNSTRALKPTPELTEAVRRRTGRITGATGLALAVALFTASGAPGQAQNCGPAPLFGQNLVGLASSALAATVASGADVIAANTAFLTQSTVFVNAPPGAQSG